MICKKSDDQRNSLFPGVGSVTWGQVTWPQFGLRLLRVKWTDVGLNNLWYGWQSFVKPIKFNSIIYENVYRWCSNVVLLHNGKEVKILVRLCKKTIKNINTVNVKFLSHVFHALYGVRLSSVKKAANVFQHRRIIKRCTLAKFQLKFSIYRYNQQITTCLHKTTQTL